ncbi:UBX domain-containing protein 7-like isoform X2 [Dreissena polymorpha]|uniref:UBX domain-containing protein 7-like isoform X2 n=1 Tax=Dreissena polymorpha TaxID=45954 RepID=UPI0022640486|nr:UBX domain-containing protein 7-like isoform X2 [Dreissena polymorpha]
MEKPKSKKKVPSLIDQFCSVTGASRDVGKQLLEACNNNLELAINMQMEGAGAPTGPGPSSDIDAVRAPIPQTQEVLVDDAPAFAAYNRRKRKAVSVFDGFRDFQEEAKQKTRGRTKKGLQEEELLSGPSGSRTRKTRTLQDLFRPPLDLTYKGTFVNAREAGKSQGRWLLVNIQNVQEFACQALNRDIWSNTAVKALIKGSFIFWQVYHDSEEGQRYCQFYKVEGWPYVAILDPQTGENLVTWNKLEPLTFCDLVGDFLKKHPAIDCLSPSQPKKREDSLLEASEDDQLQAAITASLTELSKPSSTVSKAPPGSDSEFSDDLETFSDSGEESGSPSISPVKTGSRQQYRSGSPSSKSHSPTARRSPRNSSGSDEDKNDGAAATVRRSRRQSPLATCTANEIGGKPKKNSSPHQVKNASPLAKSAKNGMSPKTGSPHLKGVSPVKVASKVPQESTSIHNDVHPTVIDNIRRHSLSENDDSKDLSSVTEESDPLESDQSSLDLHEQTDTRDYKTFLGPESDEKVTLMLRLPDGQKEKLCIALSSKLLAVVLFLGTKGYSNERYEMVTQFPRRNLSQLDFDKTLKQIGLPTQETIFIQARS